MNRPIGTAQRAIAVLMPLALFPIVMSGASAGARAREVSPHAIASGWQRRVERIAGAVERLRGERFTTPVRVDFVGDREFDQRTAATTHRAAPSRRALEMAAGEMRALGYTDRTDEQLRDVPSSVNLESLRAVYSAKTKRILARRSDRGALGDAILAHELTHALDDQTLDLQALGRKVHSVEAAFFLGAVVEGTATYIMRRYLDTLSTDRQKEFFDAQQDLVTRTLEKLANLPTIVRANSLFPYTVGQWLPALIAAKKGPAAITGIFRHPPTYGIQLLDPTTYLGEAHARRLRPPTRDAGEKRLTENQFGASSLFFVLSSRIDPRAALAAADGWRGGAETLVRRGDTVCAHLVFTGRDPGATAAIATAFAQWSSTMPDGAVTTDVTTRAQVGVTTCDPGIDANVPTTDADAAMGLPLVRNALMTRAVAEHHARLADAKCAADRVVNESATAGVIVQSHLAALDVIPPAVVERFADRLPNAIQTCQRTASS